MPVYFLSDKPSQSQSKTTTEHHTTEAPVEAQKPLAQWFIFYQRETLDAYWQHIWYLNVLQDL